MSAELVKYDAMCRAIAEAHALDEVKDIRDKAIALEAYARQIGNTEAEDQCYQIRMRAQRRAGELSKQLEKGAGNQYASPRGAEKQKVLVSAGISTQQASEWERLSEVPEPQFEAALVKRVTARGIIDDYARSHRSEPAKKSILDKSLLPPGTDEEAWAQQRRWDMISHHLEALCESVDDVEPCTRAEIAAGRVTPENVARLARLGLALTNATGDILKADGTLHFMASRRDSSLN